MAGSANITSASCLVFLKFCPPKQLQDAEFHMFFT